ncbi:MAG TPA: S9 family peptidase [Actinomycetes bacterium]|nr:S9 family peptidase [Actinomycetes bacterium]
MTDDPRAAPSPAPPFGLDHFLELPRVSGLAVSPDGRRLVTTVATVAADGKRFVTSLWELDTGGQRQPRRLTRSSPGETGAAFLPDGSLLFTSSRGDPEAPAETDGGEGGEQVNALWLLPAGGGEARAVASAPGGIGTVGTARDAGTVAWVASLFPGTETLEEDREHGKARSDAGVTAALFDSYPIRYWDHYLGPREPRLFTAPAPAASEGRIEPGRALTPAPGRALDEAGFSLTPDGSTVVTTWQPDEVVLNPRTQLVAIEVATGERRVLLDDQASSVDQVACSPDGRSVVCQRTWHSSPKQAQNVTLWVVDLASGQGRDLLPGFDLWPAGPVWVPDSQALLFVADQAGRTPVFRVEVGGESAGRVTRLCAEGSFSDLCPAPDGHRLYALRSDIASPPGAVALDATAADQRPEPVATPGLPLSTPGRVTEVHTRAADGVPLRAWLVLPREASHSAPAPLAVFIHGGPLASWSGWHWRWNPHLLAARGYAVLLPDPGMSTGYGQDFIGRGHGRWGSEPFTDVMTLVDATLARPDVDETRTAAMGGSFGGYMANWVAGHTRRFSCIVTHASLWSLEQFHGTTDNAIWWEREFGSPEDEPARYRASSPDRHRHAIRTPMLVTHGERDYRVPIGEGLRLWTDLKRHGVEAKFLYFPDENHWILRPPHVRVWYETVLAFLDQHVLGKDWVRPRLL